MDGTGGYLTLPLYLIDRWQNAPLPGRPLGNLATNVPLPKQASSINIPRLTTSPGASPDLTDGGSVTETDLADAQCTSPVLTIAGHADMSLQLLEQSPASPGLDIIAADALLQSYGAALEAALMNGTTVNGKSWLGVLQVSGTNSISYTSGSPTPVGMWVPVSQAASAIGDNRYRPPEAVFMHPRRWWWTAGGSDAAGRPLFLPGAGPTRSAITGEGLGDTVPLGPLLNMPVFLESQIPTDDTTGGGTGEDVVVVMRPSDTLLFEGEPHVDTFTEVLSATLGVRFRLRHYAAWIPNLFPTAISVISGTGLSAPSGY